MQGQDTPDWYRKYLDYLRSPEWRVKRDAALERAGRKCQLCSLTNKLQVHHNTYANLYREAPADLLVLCDDCHGKHHDVLAQPIVGKTGKVRRASVQGASLPVRCPYCGAKADEPCTRSGGNPRSRVHALRITLSETGRVPPASPKRRKAGPRPNRPKPKVTWQGDTLNYLAAAPGVIGLHVAKRFKITLAQANGRLAHLADTGSAIKIAGGWYAVSVNGSLIRKPLSRGWRPKNAVY